MLRFNSTKTIIKNIPKNISIHPMLRFNSTKTIIKNIPKKFQYILCYGSTTHMFLNNTKLNHFNTSYVTVQRGSMVGLNLLMSYFNTSYVTVQRLGFTATPIRLNGFQYILCYGSTRNGSPLMFSPF